MVEQIFGTIGDAITQFATQLGNGFSSIISMVYTTEGGITPLGTLLLVGTAVGIVYWTFNLVRGLVSVRGE